MNDWFDNDEFWTELAPYMFSQYILDSAPSEVEAIIQLLELVPDAKILDLCCGPGRHSLAFARNGFKVTGVDRTTKFLNKLRQQAAKEDLQVELVQDDMRTFSRQDEFDVAIMMYTVLGYFQNEQDNFQVIKNVFHSLKRGGAVLIELMGKEIVQRIYQSRDWQEIDGTYLLEEREVNEDWSRMFNRRIIIQEGKTRTFEFSLRMYSADELKTMLVTAGFSNVTVYGNLNGDPYDEKARRLVIVGYK